VGGHVRPRAFPYHSPSAILRNETDRATGKVKLVVATNEVNPDLREIGLVTDAKWVDLNGDSWQDLVIVGEWMPIRMFENQKGKLVEIAGPALKDTDGLWNCIEPLDIEGDGDIDFIVGNAGSNLPWRVSVDAPLTVRYGDFNGDNRMDPLISYYNHGKEYPIATRDEMLFQLPVLKKHYNNYSSYARANVAEILQNAAVHEPKIKHIKLLQTIALINNGSGSFAIDVLPNELQISSVHTIISPDNSQKNITDIFLFGNFYSSKTQFGRSDASFGSKIQYEDGRIKVQQNALFDTCFDARKAAILDGHYLLILSNFDKIRVFERDN
ncbi:MAG: FG-GAP-like repeat-containing protein, partial [Cyclobacteriaceae bacterium]